MIKEYRESQDTMRRRAHVIHTMWCELVKRPERIRADYKDVSFNMQRVGGADVVTLRVPELANYNAGRTLTLSVEEFEVDPMPRLQQLVRESAAKSKEYIEREVEYVRENRERLERRSEDIKRMTDRLRPWS